MKLRILTALLAIAVVAIAASAGTKEQLFKSANSHYTAGAYDKAIVDYEMVLNAGAASPELYFNLGNAYFRSGQLGKAIMNYIRAQRLDPRDEDVRANLRFARQFAIDKLEITEETIILDYVSRFFDFFTLGEIAGTTLLLYVLLMALILARYLYRWIMTPHSLLISLIALLVVGVLFTSVKLDRDYLNRTGVILDQQAEVKNGPGSEFASQFTAHAGLTFTIEREESGFYLVDFANRLKGWISVSAVSEI